ncbi:hypothetical protein LY78DRAFT_496403 [Colletotrichum sublineola]|nr:hypothetical protein LY78DRAFT_496403 [Colletotrichum sublineola]
MPISASPTTSRHQGQNMPPPRLLSSVHHSPSARPKTAKWFSQAYIRRQSGGISAFSLQPRAPFYRTTSHRNPLASPPPLRKLPPASAHTQLKKRHTRTASTPFDLVPVVANDITQRLSFLTGAGHCWDGQFGRKPGVDCTLHIEFVSRAYWMGHIF